MIKIVKGDEPVVVKNLIITIYSLPGLGKTTLGLTAQTPLLLDFDNGFHRAAKRGDRVPITTWDEVNGLDANDLLEHDTIVIDVVGRCLEVLAAHIIKNNPRLGKSDGSLSLQGYGSLNNAFKSFLSKLRSFGKDIVLLAHAKEDKENDNIIYRLDVMGSSKNEITKLSDLIGYLSTVNNKTTLNFTPTESFIGKNCASLSPLVIPDIKENNTYLADVISNVKSYINAKTEEQIKKEESFNAALEVINCAVEPEEFTDLIPLVKDSAPLKAHLHKTATEVKNYIYDPEIKGYKRRIVATKEKTQSDIKEEIEADIHVEPNSGEVMGL